MLVSKNIGQLIDSSFALFFVKIQNYSIGSLQDTSNSTGVYWYATSQLYEYVYPVLPRFAFPFSLYDLAKGYFEKTRTKNNCSRSDARANVRSIQ